MQLDLSVLLAAAACAVLAGVAAVRIPVLWDARRTRGGRATGHARRDVAAAAAVTTATAALIAAHWWLLRPPATFALVVYGAVGGMICWTLALAWLGRRFDHLAPAGGRVVAVVPAFQESPELLRACVESLLAQTRPPDGIHVIDDGSEPALEPLELPGVIWHRQESNDGKRRAQYVVFADAGIPADFYLTVDSDTVCDSGALAACLRALANRRIMAATALPLVRNARANWLTRLTEIETVSGCYTVRAAKSARGCVSPTTGAFSVYRARVVRDHLDEYVADGTAGDDRRLTHFAALQGEVVAPEDAFVFTQMPETVRGAWQQRVRWFKSFWRYSGWEYRNLPGLAFAWRAWGLLMFVLSCTMIAWSLVVYPLLRADVAWQGLVYWTVLQWMLALRWAVKRPGLSRRERWTWWALGAPFVAPLNLLLIRPAQLWAAFRCRTLHWHTRTVTVPTAEPSSVTVEGRA